MLNLYGLKAMDVADAEMALKLPSILAGVSWSEFLAGTLRTRLGVFGSRSRLRLERPHQRKDRRRRASNTRRPRSDTGWRFIRDTSWDTWPPSCTSGPPVLGIVLLVAFGTSVAVSTKRMPSSSTERTVRSCLSDFSDGHSRIPNVVGQPDCPFPCSAQHRRATHSCA